MTFWQTILITLVAGVLASIPSAMMFIGGKKREAATAKKTEADYADQIIKTAMVLITPLEARIAVLEKELKMEQEYRKMLVKSYENHVAYLLDGISKLIQQLVDNGIAPVWRPEKMALTPMPDFPLENDIDNSAKNVKP
jgi:hypothetical protein